MNLCEFKGLPNSAIQARKLLTLKNSGFGKHWLSQISLFKIDICPLIHTKYLSIGHFSYTKSANQATLFSLIAPATAACVATTALCQGCQVLLYHYISSNSTYSEIDVMPLTRSDLSCGDQGRQPMTQGFAVFQLLGVMLAVCISRSRAVQLQNFTAQLTTNSS